MLITESEARTKSSREQKRTGRLAESLLVEFVEEQKQKDAFDIFLSHAFLDKDLILGVALLIEEDFGHSVFIDWRDDPSLDRSKVSERTAGRLRRWMFASKSLVYARTENSSQSVWMPWELGFMDGLGSGRGISPRVAILPLAKARESEFKGVEYLGLYPYIEEGINVATEKNILWVAKSAECYVSYDKWLKGKDPFIP